MAHCTQLCTTKKKFYSQQFKNFFLGITLFDTFSLLFQKEKNLMPLFLIACNRGLNVKKTKYMLFRKQKRTDIRELNLRISNDAIQPVDDFNFLGLHINSK